MNLRWQKRLAISVALLVLGGLTAAIAEPLPESPQLLPSSADDLKYRTPGDDDEPVRPSAKRTPIPAGANVPTEKKVQLAKLKFLSADIEEYKRHTKDEASARAAGQKFLEDFNKYQTAQVGCPSLQELGAAGKKAIEAGCKDPLIVMRYGAILSNLSDGEEPEKLLQQAIADLAGSPYKPRQAMLARLWIFNAAHSRHARPTHDEVAKTTEAVLAYLAAEPNQKANRRFIYYYVSTMLKMLDQSDAKVFAEACIKLPQLDPWVKEMTSGSHELRTAWHYRGEGWASQVSEPAWKAMREHAELAAVALGKAWKLDPSLPEAPAEMIEVAKIGGDKSDPRVWFDRAVKAQFDYMPAYNSYRDVLRPRWRGSDEALYEFGTECFETRRFDTVIPLVFVSCLGQIDEDSSGESMVWQRAGVWTTLREMYAETAKKRKGEERAELYSLLAAAAVRAGEYSDARVVMERLKNELKTESFAAFDLDLSHAKALVYAATGAAATQVSRLETVLAKLAELKPDDYQQLLAEVQAARKVNKDQRGEAYFAFWDLALKRRLQFEKGDWVDLTFDKDLRGWKASGTGKWKVLDEHSVLLTDRADESLVQVSNRLEPAIALSGPLEVQVMVENVGPEKFCLSGGVAVGNARNSLAGRHIWANPAENRVGVEYLGQGGRPIRGALSSLVSIKIKAWPNYIETNFGDEMFWRIPDAVFNPTGGLALTTSPRWSGRGSLKFSNLRVRKLTHAAPPATEEIQAMIDYDTRLLEQEPDNVLALNSRANNYFKQRKMAESLADFTKAVTLSPNSSQLRVNRGNVLKNHNRQFEAAMADFDEALQLRPQNTFAVLSRGNIFMIKRDYRTAAKLYADSLLIDPDYVTGHVALGWVLASAPEDDCRNGAKAIEHGLRAVELSRETESDPMTTLAAGYAECGKFAEAIEWQAKALTVASEEEKRTILKDMELYKAGKPLRQKKRR